MTVVFMDGFDKYGPAGQSSPSVTSLLVAEWLGGWGGGSTTPPAIVAGLSSSGTALSLYASNNTAFYIYQTSFQAKNFTRVMGGMRFSTNLASPGPYGITFTDAGTPQASVVVNSNGTISVRSGGSGGINAWGGGSVIATSSVLISANVPAYIEWDLTFGTSGAYAVYLNGNPTPVLSGTGNLRAGTSNAYANGCAVGCFTYYGSCVVDDIYLDDAIGRSTPLLSNPVVETTFPSGDAQAQWSAGATIIGTDNSATASTNAPGANQLFLQPFTAPANMTLNSVSCKPMATSGTAKFKPVLYGAVPALTGHRYWRLLSNGGGGSYTTIAEIQFRTTVGVPLAFGAGTASASSGNAASGASDGNAATYWQAAGHLTGEWWQWDYGAGVTPIIAEVVLVASTQGINSYVPPDYFDLQFSDDGSTWTTAANFAATTWSAGQQQNFNVTARPIAPGSAGSPLIAVGNEVVGTTSGATLTAAFASGQALIGGVPYGIGFITDTSIVLAQADTTPNGTKRANIYTSGAPIVCVGVTTAGQPSWQIWGNGSGSAANWPSVSANPPVDDIACVSSSTVGQEDLYSFPPLSSNPAVVYAVGFKARTQTQRQRHTDRGRALRQRRQ